MIQLVLGLGVGIWNLNLNYFFVSKGLGLTEIGELFAITPISAALAAMFSGYLSDRYCYRKLFITGTAIKCLSMIIIVYAPNFMIMAFARVINGLGEALVNTSAYPYVTTMVDDKDKNSAYSLLFATIMISMFLGNIFGSFDFIMTKGAQKYGVAMICGAGVLLLGNIFMFSLPVTKMEKTSSRGIYIPENKHIVWNLVFEFLGYTCYFLATSLFNIIFRDFIGIGEERVGWLLGTMILFGGIASFFVPWIVNVIGRKKATISVLLAITLAYFMMTYFRGNTFIVLAIVSTIISLTVVGLVEGAMLQKISPSDKGKFSGLKILITSAGTSGGAYLAGDLLNNVGGVYWIYAISAILSLAQLIIYKYAFADYIEAK